MIEICLMATIAYVIVERKRRGHFKDIPEKSSLDTSDIRCPYCSMQMADLMENVAEKSKNPHATPVTCPECASVAVWDVFTWPPVIQSLSSVRRKKL